MKTKKSHIDADNALGVFARQDERFPDKTVRVWDTHAQPAFAGNRHYFFQPFGAYAHRDIDVPSEAWFAVRSTACPSMIM